MNSSSGGSPGSDVTSNNISLAAAVLAAGAFVIAFAQAFMEYLGSSASRGKCTYEAIGMSAKSTSWGWNWRFWKLRVYYPILDISYEKVRDAATDQCKLRDDSPLANLSDNNESWGWYILDESKMNNSLFAVS
jgi:hypothetical protein